jgi:hypothetical protein
MFEVVLSLEKEARLRLRLRLRLRCWDIGDGLNFLCGNLPALPFSAAKEFFIKGNFLICHILYLHTLLSIG